MKTRSNFCRSSNALHCATLLVLGCLPNLLAATERLPIEAFAALPKIQDIGLSPDGNHLAYLRNEGGNTFLLTHDLKAQKQHAITRTDNEKYTFKWLRWVSNEDVLLSLYFPARRQGVATGETRLISAGPGREGVKVLGLPRSTPYNQQHLGQFQDDVVSYLPDDPEHILVALDLERPTLPGVYRINVRSGHQKRVQRSRDPIRSWVADQQGKVRAAYGFDATDNMYSLWIRRTGEKKWRMVSEWEALKQADTTPLGFGLNPKDLYVRADHQGRAAIFKLDTDSANFSMHLVVADPQHDINGGLVRAPETSEVIGVHHSHSPGRVMYFDESHATLTRSVENALPDTFNQILGQSNDGMRYLVHAGASHIPGKYYFGDREKSTLHAFAEDYPLLAGKELARARQILFETRDGLELKGYLWLPPDSDGLNLPTIVLPGGGLMSGSNNGFNYWAQFFTNRGYAAVQLVFRSTGGNSYEFGQQAIQVYGGSAHDDIADAADWLIERGIAGKHSICVAGSGYGGYAALMATVKAPAKYRCVISLGAVTDLIAVRDTARFYVRSKVIREQVGTQSDRLKRLSPLYQAEKIQVPVLLAHGARDRSVMIDQAEDMAKALKDAGAKYRYLELENGSHFLPLEKNRLAFFKAMEEFLEQHLPVKG